jgi:hypothetical protein
VKLLLAVFVVINFGAFAQLPMNEEQFLSRLQPGGPLPEKLLSAKSVVFYPYTMTLKELESFQKAFKRCGIDAVVYYENDYVWAGRDPAVNLAGLLTKREISNLVYLQKLDGLYKILIAPYNQKANLVEQDQACWTLEHRALDVLVQRLFSTVANTMKNENLLVNEYPETGFGVRAIDGNRNEFFAIDLKVDQLAVPKFGNEIMDKELEEIMKLYPYKYMLTEANLSESELRKQGYLYVLRFVHARNKVVRNILGYGMTKAQSAIASHIYSENGQQLKNIPANEVVYKFYFKHIESENVFLGTKWDADPSWQQALLNQLKGFRTEFKIP